MIPAGDAIERRRLRAPRAPGGVLIDPPLATVAAHLAANLALAQGWHYDVHGRPLRELAVSARRELLASARQYTASYRNVDDSGPSPTAPIVLTGHQPQLYHPGVWFKNFALSEISRRHATHAVNLLIDNDTLRTVSIRIPTGSRHEPYVTTVALDEPGDEIPYEERSIRDRGCFDSFGERTAAAIAPFVPHPLIRDLWPHAMEAARHTPNLGRCLSRARHILESQWGLRTLEVPLSTVCQSAAFRWFALHLLAEAPRLRNVHNSVLADYRRVHRVRSRSHPVPDLAADDDWHEVPFWLWSTAAPRRRRAFVRRHHERLELTDRGQILERLELGSSAPMDRAMEQLCAAEAGGIKLRPRALMTTLYARLVLGDLFLHGIGGAQYDQLTDALVRRFLGVVPPAFFTLTATVHLPIEHAMATAADLRGLDAELRALRFHPEVFVDPSLANVEVRRLVEAKRRWLAINPPLGRSYHDERAQRCCDLRTVNESLQPLVAARRAELLDRRLALERVVAQHALFASREYALCLFPEKYLCALLLESCNAEP